jgi:hypothetical protein
MEEAVKRTPLGVLAGICALLVTTPNVSRADVIDLTAAGNSGTRTVTLGGTFIVQQIPDQSTGTGVIDPFVRMGSNSTNEQGYNTGGRPLQFDENSSPNFTRDLHLSTIPIVNIGGTNYRQFLLDINQTGTSPLLSLNQIQIFQSTSSRLDAALTVSSVPTLQFGSGATEIFRMNTTADRHEILMNYSLNSGSGSGDMFLYVPDADFDPSIDFVLLYSEFGDMLGGSGANDGFEEWSTLTAQGPGAVPAPAGVVLLGIGAGLTGLLRWRKNRSA